MARAEIGIEWVLEYHGRASDTTYCKTHAEAFYNKLDGVKIFNWGDDLAWDQDFEESGAGKPSEGTDTIWADDVDIVYFSGHGNDKGPLFGVTEYDSGKVKSDEVRLGNGDLEWIVFNSCRVLEKNGNYYKNATDMFRGLHYMLGFHTNANDEPDRGEIFADYLNKGYTVRTAWKKACQETADSDREWAYLRADDDGSDTYYDHWWDKGDVSQDPNPGNQTIYYLKGTC